MSLEEGKRSLEVLQDLQVQNKGIIEYINFKYTAFKPRLKPFFPDELKSCLKLSLLHQRTTQKAKRDRRSIKA